MARWRARQGCYARPVLRLLPSPRGLLLLALAAAGCGRSHDLGVVTTTSTASSSSSAATTSTGTGGTGGAGGATASSSSSGTGGVDAGPPGATKLTVVNGINDYPSVRFCFLPGDTPWPDLASGLPFADGQAIPLGTGPITGDTDVTPWVIAGDLDQIDGKTCTQILALATPGGDGGLPPPVIAQALAVIPKLVFDSHKSLLLVADGCLGGGDHDDASAVSACGTGYTSQNPTAGAFVVSMSRVVDPVHLSLQVVNGSTALPESDVKILPNLTTGATDSLIVGSLSQGAIGPTMPFAKLGVPDLGPLAGVKLETYVPGSSSMQSTVALGDILANGPFGASALADGEDFVLVAVGSSPSLPAGGFWHAFTYAMVLSDPQ